MTMACVWTADDISELVQLLGEGCSRIEIAERMGRSVNSVRRAIERLRYRKTPPPIVRNPWTPDADATLTSMRDAGHDWPAIAEAIDHPRLSCKDRYNQLVRSGRHRREATVSSPDKTDPTWPRPYGMGTARIAWANENRGNCEAEMILILAASPILRRDETKGWVPRVMA